MRVQGRRLLVRVLKVEEEVSGGGIHIPRPEADGTDEVTKALVVKTRDCYGEREWEGATVYFPRFAGLKVPITRDPNDDMQVVEIEQILLVEDK